MATSSITRLSLKTRYITKEINLSPNYYFFFHAMKYLNNNNNIVNRTAKLTHKVIVSFHSGFNDDLIVFDFFFTPSVSGISFSLT